MPHTNADLAAYGLSRSLVNILHDAGITTIDQLRSTYEQEVCGMKGMALLDLKGVGEGRLCEVKRVLGITKPTHCAVCLQPLP